MAYIRTEEVKEIRNAIKAALPEFKFSIVRNSGMSGVIISIMAGNFDFENEFGTAHQQINHFHTDFYSEEAAAIFNKITEIATADQSESHYCQDYGSIPNFYFELSVGKWNKGYKLTK